MGRNRRSRSPNLEGCRVETLDQYLTDQYLTDQQELARLDRAILETSATLVEAFNKRRGWPYRLKRGAERDVPRKASDVSHSTTAMVALSLLKLIGDWKKPDGFAPTPTFASAARSALSFTSRRTRRDLILGSAIAVSGRQNHATAADTVVCSFRYSSWVFAKIPVASSSSVGGLSTCRSRSTT